MLAAIVDTKALLQSVAAALVTGLGITTAFAIMIFGISRSADMARNDRPVMAAAAGGLAVVALAVVIGAIVLGIVVMTTKS